MNLLFVIDTIKYTKKKKKYITERFISFLGSMLSNVLMCIMFEREREREGEK